ncbi:hypothetical protein AWJ20_4605 [Sugiyamaella lignohabitans]|uniref:Endoplasmic reticulum junction formation protein lunapark n=1 Tax=Sugiyamaella lignohabitans TaxID=796027 RepID=A0A167E5H5_9ASCO|nr:uncharacterized protein AWJ20_4605 [Sugiyamaella lignohabitans]ANB13663.1 hypothetical protein AWJ20_4605 [Sugiyamaella lignohabitans]
MSFYQAKAILDRFGLSHGDTKNVKSKDQASDASKEQKGKKRHPQKQSGQSQPENQEDSYQGQEDSVPGVTANKFERTAQPGLEAQGQRLPSTFIPTRPPYTPYEPKWYDRILDLLVGEDEQSPNSRYALICQNCRMHNGLCQFGEKPQFVVYYCPHCGMQNGEEEHPEDDPKESKEAGRQNVKADEGRSEQESTKKVDAEIDIKNGYREYREGNGSEDEANYPNEPVNIKRKTSQKSVRQRKSRSQKE